MFNSPILDVAIGLAFIFLLLSLLVTAVCELLAGFFKWRAANLWLGIEHLLQSPDARDKIYNHPLIRGLAPIGSVPAAKGGGGGRAAAVGAPPAAGGAPAAPAAG